MQKNKGFTLIELVIVIIIVGILATVGLSQYHAIMEKGRISECKAAISYMRHRIDEYYLNNGTLAGITNNDLGIGTDLPGSCDSSHYFAYGLNGCCDYATSGIIEFGGTRCTTGGKFPQGGSAYYYHLLYYEPSGQSDWHCYGDSQYNNFGLPG